MTKTLDSNSWAFKLNELKMVSGTLVHKYLGVDAMIEPAYPYIYLPTTLWQGLVDLMNNHNFYRNMAVSEDIISFRSTCDQVET